MRFVLKIVLTVIMTIIIAVPSIVQPQPYRVVFSGKIIVSMLENIRINQSFDVNKVNSKNKPFTRTGNLNKNFQDNSSTKTSERSFLLKSKEKDSFLKKLLKKQKERRKKRREERAKRRKKRRRERLKKRLGLTKSRR